MADLSPLTYGRIVGRFLAIVGDTGDAGDNPDAIAAEGTITFQPSVSDFVKVPGATPTPATAAIRPITVTIDADGYLSWNSQVGVWVVATDDPVVTAFTYTVSFALTVNGEAVFLPARTIEVPAGSTYDLSAGIELPVNQYAVNAWRSFEGMSVVPPGNECTVTNASDWAHSGSQSVKMVPTGTNDSRVNIYGDPGTFALEPEKSYTIIAVCHVDTAQTGTQHANARTIMISYSDTVNPVTQALSAAAPNTPGDHELRLSVDIPSGTLESWITLWNGASSGNGTIWWDDLVVLEVPSAADPYTGPLSPYTMDSPY